MIRAVQVEIHGSTTHFSGRPSHRVAQRRVRMLIYLFTATAIVIALLPIDAVRAAESPLVKLVVCHELGAGWTVDTALPPSWIERSVPQRARRERRRPSPSARRRVQHRSRCPAPDEQRRQPGRSGLLFGKPSDQPEPRHHLRHVSVRRLGADGIAFTLAAANPANPRPPTIVGPAGSDLGYTSAVATGPRRLPRHRPRRLRGFEGSGSEGSGCTNLPQLIAPDAYAELVTARGPGNERRVLHARKHRNDVSESRRRQSGRQCRSGKRPGQPLCDCP